MIEKGSKGNRYNKVTLGQLSLEVGYGLAVEIFDKNQKLNNKFWKKLEPKLLKKIITSFNVGDNIREKAIRALKKYLISEKKPKK